jgi:hypothetical protein
MSTTALRSTRAVLAPSAPGLHETGRASSPRLDAGDDADVDLRVDVHDASRIEWTVVVPLPERRGLAYSIDVKLEIPANVFARHIAWDQLQSWARLDGAGGVVDPSDHVTIDALRRGTMAFAHRLSRALDGFARHCRLAGAVSASTPLRDLIDHLDVWLAVATTTTSNARAQLVTPSKDDTAELQRERQLVDEYISVRFLEALAGAERSLAALRESRHVRRHARTIAAAEAKVARALSAEIVHRQTRGYLCAEPSSPSALEHYLDRASQLKKHFQEVFFLEAQTYKVAERIHHWVAAFVALVASTWAFVWQMALMNQRPTTGSQVGSGIILLATIAGVVYAGKDRIKEIGRNWISGNVHRFYAQRVARWRAPARRLPGRDVVVSARESFDQTVTSRPDPLNPASSAAVASTVVHYTHRGRVLPQPALLASGVTRVKHIFRYDLSPLFARLDDAVKKVPVVDGRTKRVCFIDAPRRYRVPVRLQVECGSESRVVQAVLVLHKQGLDRLEDDGPEGGTPDPGATA